MNIPTDPWKPMSLALAALLAGLFAASPLRAEDKIITIHPAEYGQALRNPLMGISRKNYKDAHFYGSHMAMRGLHPWSTLARVCIPWSWLENDEQDGVEKIRQVSDELFTGFEAHNTKVIPRVFLHFPNENPALRNKPLYMRGDFWPAGLEANDYSSEKFNARLKRFIGHLGEAWDNDCRIGMIEMGIIGKWGEQTTPPITPEMEKTLGDAFSAAFKRKKIMTRVRPMTNFDNYSFGFHWDSFAHQDQLAVDGKILEKSNKWKLGSIGGETAYDWGSYKIQPGDSPTDSLADPVHRDFIVGLARRLHVMQLGWIAEYDQSNPRAAEGAEILQKALGYRFVLREASFPARIEAGKSFALSFRVRNDGSAPFYEDWPVALVLLDPLTRKEAWRQTFDKVDLRGWLPGDDWDHAAHAYRAAAKEHVCSGEFQIPAGFAQGEYVAALAVLDRDGGMMPSLRFSNRNYWNGGYFPLGRIGVGQLPRKTAMDEAEFDDPGRDASLHYVNPKLSPERRAAWVEAERKDPLGLCRPFNRWNFISNWDKDDEVVQGAVSVVCALTPDPEPRVVLRYDFSKIKRSWVRAVAQLEDFCLPPSTQSLVFSVRSESPFTMQVKLLREDRFEYTKPGQWQQFTFPFRDGENPLSVTHMWFGVEKRADNAQSGEVSFGRFNVSIQPSATTKDERR